MLFTDITFLIRRSHLKVAHRPGLPHAWCDRQLFPLLASTLLARSSHPNLVSPRDLLGIRIETRIVTALALVANVKLRNTLHRTDVRTSFVSISLRGDTFLILFTLLNHVVYLETVIICLDLSAFDLLYLICLQAFCFIQTLTVPDSLFSVLP